MIDASSGKILWKAGHHEAEDYMLIKPKLPDVAKNVFRKMIKECLIQRSSGSDMRD